MENMQDEQSIVIGLDERLSDKEMIDNEEARVRQVSYINEFELKNICFSEF